MTPLETTPDGTDRRTDLEQRLDAVHSRITAATAAAGRTREPQLVVVTKFFPATDVRLLHGLGVRHVGENRDQEASAKAAELADLELDWHFIGQLQANKAKTVVRYARAVHSLDRDSLAAALGKAMRRENERRAELGDAPRAALETLIQVDLRDATDAAGNESGTARGGADPAEVGRLADQVAETDGLALRGLMAVAPLGEDPTPAFERLARIAEEVRSNHPQATWISAGMSHDLEQAVAAGATHLRVGSDVLGPRPPVL
ncbi:YggS family pyridoxal phosphate-dependent enzyme [Arthrobacter sp. JSM 101049]|uniref:YggS family pyridoxal phosphate-dependent enzyme n=1 Tax=Arthrobacter sp. JSM 101049 TaxID=929097 RepID=UPI0035655EB4